MPPKKPANMQRRPPKVRKRAAVVGVVAQIAVAIAAIATVAVIAGIVATAIVEGLQVASCKFQVRSPEFEGQSSSFSMRSESRFWNPGALRHRGPAREMAR